MAWQVSKRVWDNVPSNIIQSDRVMLLALAERADEHGICWPSYDALAKMTGVNERSAIRIIEKLEQCGLIFINRQQGQNGGRGYTNVYFVTVGLSPEEVATTKAIHPMLIKGVVDNTHSTEEKGVTGDKKGVTGDKKGVTGDKKGVTDNTRTIIEPSYKPSYNSFNGGREKLPKITPLVKAIAQVCCLDLGLIQNGTIKELKSANEVFIVKRTAPEQILEFEQWRKEYHWSGKTPPTLKQLCELFAQYEQWVKDGRPSPQPKNGAQTNGTYQRQNQPTGIDLSREATFDPYTGRTIPAPG